MPEKSRFLRLLDISLRSSKIPTKTVASFLKRLSRVLVSFGEGYSPQDIMFVASFIVNMIKRHPGCIKLIHRKLKESDSKVLEKDPYQEDEVDPLEARALKSCLWEIDALMKHHYDERVRTYCKVFKSQFQSKEAFIKCEEFTQVDPLDMLLQDLNEIDDEKEGQSFKKNLLGKHGQDITLRMGMKRTAD